MSRSTLRFHAPRPRASSAGRARWLIALVSTLVALAAAELVARAAYTAPWFDRLVAEQRANTELEYERNSYNLRGPDYTDPKSPDTRRVLVIGDSFTFGMGVARDEDTFVRRCERRLTEELRSEGVQRVELFNGSIIGSLTFHWTQIWDTMKARFEPDLVVFVFFLRDGTLAGSLPEFFDVIRDEVAARNRDSFTYRHLALARFWKDAQDRERIRTHYTRLFRDAYFGDEEATAEWRRAQAHLARMTRDARERGCEAAFVIFPILAGLNEDPYPFQNVCDELAKFAREQGLETLDLLPAFRGHDGPELWVSPFDQHPNERAHEIAAKALTPFLARLLR